MASIEIQSLNENFLGFHQIYPTATASVDSATYLQTQAAILRQDGLLEQVANQLQLGERPEYRKAANIADKLREDIRIVPLRDTRIIQIVSHARSPQLAAQLGDALAEAFIEQNINQRQRAAWETYASLRSQLDKLPGRSQRPQAETAAKAVPSSKSRLYEAMLQSANDAWVASRVRQPNVRLISAATPPNRPYLPNVPLNMAIGLASGLVLAVGSTLALGASPRAFRAPGEAALFLGVPELGAIPKAGSGRRAALAIPAISTERFYVERASLTHPSSNVSESFRATVASILAMRRDGECPRVWVVTSPGYQEGKTTVASNLGIALANIGSRVLLIDGDLRRPKLHEVFDKGNSWGLSDLLVEKNAIDELPLDVLVKRTAASHVFLLPGGTCADNIFGLLCSGRMARLMSRVRKEFDYVLVEAPPCLEFADARIMARYADSVLLVLRANYTSRANAQSAVERHRQDGASTMGIILNRWNPADAVHSVSANGIGSEGAS